MSGFQNITGFAPPTSLSGFMGLLQNAFWRGVPFKVVGAQVRKGRKIALHEYPFRDGGWAEDMGRAQKIYSFTGYLIGDLAPVMQLALDAAAEEPGPGLLIHPTIGAVNVALLSCATAVRRDAMRVIEVQFEFIEQGEQSFPLQLIATAVSVVAASDLLVSISGGSIGSGSPGAAAAMSPTAIGAGVTTVQGFATACIGAAGDSAAIAALAVALPTDVGSSNGRFAAGNASLLQPPGTTIGGLQAQVALQRGAVVTAGIAAAAAVNEFTPETGPAVSAALSGLTEATRVVMSDPADQVRILTHLATFVPADQFVSSSAWGTEIVTVRDGIASLARRMALASLARGAAAYAPVSYQDAADLRASIAAAFDAEITAAGDAGEDDVYAALKALRAAVIADLTTRGASLPQTLEVTFATALPSLTLAQMLYRDASRSDEIAREVTVPHPAFCPTTFRALAF